MSTSDSMKAINEWTNKSVERMTSLGELNMRIFEKMAARQMDAMSLYMEHAMRTMKVATESEGYNEFFKGQVDAAKDLSEQVMVETKSTMQIASEARDDYRNWLEKSLGEISADLRKTTTAA